MCDYMCVYVSWICRCRCTCGCKCMQTCMRIGLSTCRCRCRCVRMRVGLGICICVYIRIDRCIYSNINMYTYIVIHARIWHRYVYTYGIGMYTCK